jgi:hypothetical protein
MPRPPWSFGLQIIFQWEGNNGKYFYSIKKETMVRGGPLANYGSVTFKIRSNRVHHMLNHHEYDMHWSSGFFYIKDKNATGKEQGLPPLKDSARLKFRTGTPC